MEILSAGMGAQIAWPAARRQRVRGWCVLALAAAWAAPAGAQVDEYHLKAAFLYNFAKFVEWPAQAFPTPESPICLCVLGANPFGITLAETVRGRTVGGRSFAVRQILATQAPTGCQILFIPAGEHKRLRALRDSLKGAGVLTVGEDDSFTADGGVIDFKLEGGNVHLEINTAAAEYTDVRISSKLLSMAKVVRKAP